MSQALAIPATVGQGVFKARLVYGKTVESITFTPYTPRLVRTLTPVVADALEYPYKYADRSALEACLSLKGEADDILLIKQGFVTDTSYSNIIVCLNGQWLTPSTFLLNGTCRQRLLHEGLIREAPIRLEDLTDCREIRLINAMLNPWEQPPVTLLPTVC